MLHNLKKLLEDIPNKARDILGVLVDVNLNEAENQNFIEIIVESQPFPVNYKGQYHYRSGSTKQELKGAALDKFMLEKKGKKWDRSAGNGIPRRFSGQRERYIFRNGVCICFDAPPVQN